MECADDNGMILKKTYFKFTPEAIGFATYNTASETFEGAYYAQAIAT